MSNPMSDHPTVENTRETIYVCPACGKTANDTIDFSDVSCAINAVLCYKDTLECSMDGRVIKVDAASLKDTHTGEE
jgi:transposase-like protein